MMSYIVSSASDICYNYSSKYSQRGFFRTHRQRQGYFYLILKLTCQVLVYHPEGVNVFISDKPIINERTRCIMLYIKWYNHRNKEISLIDDLFANVIWNINQKNTTKNINSNKKKIVKSIDTNNQSIDSPSLDY